MEERFDRLEQMLGDLGRNLGARINGVEQGLTGLGDRMDGAEQRVGARIDGVEQGLTGLGTALTGLGSKIDGVEQRLRGHIEAVEQRVDEKFDHLNVRVSVLHEDVKSDFRFSLEALKGTEERINSRFDEQARTFSDQLAPIRDAVRTV